MRKYSYLLASIVLLLASSCEKIVSVNLNEANKTIVIEAQLIEGLNDFEVQLSETVDFFSDSSAIPMLSGAIVTLTNLTTQVQTNLVESADKGVYVAENYLATANTSYELTVVYKGKTYIAQSEMPKRAILDSLSYVYEEASLFGEAGYVVYVETNDDPSTRNYYQALVYNNAFSGDVEEAKISFDDQFTNGNRIKIPIFTSRFNGGDDLTVVLTALDRKVFKYLQELEALANDGGQSAAPANPVSNFNNGALGYFGAFTVSAKQLKLPPNPE